MSKVLALDLGASSGRAVLAGLSGGNLELQEVRRFENNPVMMNGTLYWDILRLFYELKAGLTAAWRQDEYASIGIDTWGVDFGILDQDGVLLENPVHYRDARTQNILEEILAFATKNEIYTQTGTQFMPSNTLYQLAYLSFHRKAFLKQADTILLMPDLLAYFLTGNKRTELTNASTTQLFLPDKNQWHTALMQQFGIPASCFAPLISPGESYGVLRACVAEETHIPQIPVMAVASHDTASAVLAVPAGSNVDFAYISCGTWSLLGAECDSPYLDNTDAQKYNFTNELGYGGTVRLLKNIMGLWLLQECRRQWRAEGLEMTFQEIERVAGSCTDFLSVIDPDDDDFISPGDMPEKIRMFCRRTGQPVPGSPGEISRCVYVSLALKYRMVFLQLQKITGKAYDVIHIVGGGAKDRLLGQMTASACNRVVLAGPAEATAIGNAAVQLMTLGEINTVQQARNIIRDSFPLLQYFPQSADTWSVAAERFLELTSGQKKR